MHIFGYRILICAALSILLVACGGRLPSIDDLPVDVSDLPINLDDIPGLPEGLAELPGILEDLGLPDISQLDNLPQLSDLPVIGGRQGAIVYNGPLEMRLQPGDPLPGSGYVLVDVEGEQAHFTIDGLRSTRTVGDSLDFDGPWPGTDGVTYNVRSRIYRINGDSVRIAGVHQIVVADVAPVAGDVSLTTHVIKFPFTVGISAGQQIAGTTLGYATTDENGARLTGIAEGDYPYRKMGDSIRWQGMVRSDIAVEYNIRMLWYGDNDARVGGIVSIALPNP